MSFKSRKLHLTASRSMGGDQYLGMSSGRARVVSRWLRRTDSSLTQDGGTQIGLERERADMKAQ